jgi:hypothetical protein
MFLHAAAVHDGTPRSSHPHIPSILHRVLYLLVRCTALQQLVQPGSAVWCCRWR